MSEPSEWAMEEAKRLVCECSPRQIAGEPFHDNDCPAANSKAVEVATALDAAVERGVREEREARHCTGCAFERTGCVLCVDCCRGGAPDNYTPKLKEVHHD